MHFLISQFLTRSCSTLRMCDIGCLCGWLQTDRYWNLDYCKRSRYCLSTWEKDGRPDRSTLTITFRQVTGWFRPLPGLYMFVPLVQSYHCRSGSSGGFYRAPGVLAITDEKVFVYIRDSDGKVFVSPEKQRFRSTD